MRERGRPATTTREILELLEDGEWHELPAIKAEPAYGRYWSAMYRLLVKGRVEREDLPPAMGFRQRYRLR